MKEHIFKDTNKIYGLKEPYVTVTKLSFCWKCSLCKYLPNKVNLKKKNRLRYHSNDKKTRQDINKEGKEDYVKKKRIIKEGK